MSYTTIAAAATDVSFQGRCQVATWIAAGDIISESAGTTNHVRRLDWAHLVMEDRTNITGKQLAMQVLRNSTIAAGPSSATDGDIQFQVNSVLDNLISIG